MKKALFILTLWTVVIAFMGGYCGYRMAASEPCHECELNTDQIEALRHYYDATQVWMDADAFDPDYYASIGFEDEVREFITAEAEVAIAVPDEEHNPELICSLANRYDSDILRRHVEKCYECAEQMYEHPWYYDMTVAKLGAY